MVLSPDYQAELERVRSSETVVACLCAGWCNACRGYKSAFEELAASFPACRFVWVDIEDHEALFEDADVDNFPFLSIERNGTVHFFGAVHPEASVAKMLIERALARSDEETAALTAKDEHLKEVQEFALVKRLAAVKA